MALSGEDRAEVLGLVQSQLLASAQGLLTKQFFPYLGAGRNATGRTPACIVYHDGTNAANSMVAGTPGLSHQSSGSWVAVSYNQEDHDSDGMAAPTASTLTIRTAGVWTISGAGTWAGNGTGIRGFRVIVNANTSLIVAKTLVPGHADGVTVPFVSRPVRLAAGDTLALQAFQNSTGNLAVTAEGTVSPYWGCFLSGNL